MQVRVYSYAELELSHSLLSYAGPELSHSLLCWSYALRITPLLVL